MNLLSKDIPRRFLGFLRRPDNHLVVVLEGLEPGLDVGGGVPEGLFVLDADADSSSLKNLRVLSR